jgi:hypothetical protein
MEVHLKLSIRNTMRKEKTQEGRKNPNIKK